jgi:hypothetical protein
LAEDSGLGLDACARHQTPPLAVQAIGNEAVLGPKVIILFTSVIYKFS